MISSRSSNVGAGLAARRRRWSHGLALLLCAATAVLLAAGALVTGTGSSLAVPDWPLAYGQLFPPMVGGILFEHGHRLIAAAVGLLTVALAVWIGLVEPRRWVRWLAYAAVLAVVLQGLLGGLTVLLLLPKSVSVSHALLAQFFLVLAVLLAQVTAPGWPALVGTAAAARAHPRQASRAAGWLGVATLAALEAELLLGALVRHNNAGLIIPDFPLALGRIVPPLDSFPVTIHYLHRLGALAVLVLVAGMAWAAARRHGRDAPLMRRLAAVVLFALLQVALGAAVIWTQRLLWVTTLHVVNGGALIAATMLATLRTWMLESPGSAA